MESKQGTAQTEFEETILFTTDENEFDFFKYCRFTFRKIVVKTLKRKISFLPFQRFHLIKFRNFITNSENFENEVQIIFYTFDDFDTNYKHEINNKQTFTENLLNNLLINLIRTYTNDHEHIRMFNKENFVYATFQREIKDRLLAEGRIFEEDLMTL
jgi:hypothetical protein